MKLEGCLEKTGVPFPLFYSNARNCGHGIRSSSSPESSGERISPTARGAGMAESGRTNVYQEVPRSLPELSTMMK
jgi:hypothetical protein